MPTKPFSLPPDTSLFSQLKTAVDNHVIATKPFTDEEKNFSLATPKSGTSAYKRVWTVSPTSGNIVRDIDKIFRSMLVIMEAEGIAVDNLGNRDGKRHIVNGKKQGGYRARKKPLDDYDKDRVRLHIDAKSYIKDLMKRVYVKHEPVDKSH